MAHNTEMSQIVTQEKFHSSQGIFHERIASTKYWVSSQAKGSVNNVHRIPYILSLKMLEEVQKYLKSPTQLIFHNFTLRTSK